MRITELHYTPKIQVQYNILIQSASKTKHTYGIPKNVQWSILNFLHGASMWSWFAKNTTY